MRKKVTSLMIVLLGLMSVLSLGDEFWDKKPYQEWEAKQCEKLLQDSPWSHPYAVTSVTIPGVQRQGGGTTPTRSFGDGDLAETSQDREVLLYLQIRFVTAKPIKAAIGRSRMLAEPKNKALAEQVGQYIDQPDGPEVIVEVTYYSEPAGHLSLRQIENFLRTATLPTLKERVFLSDSAKGVQVNIGRYQGPYEGYNGALLLFPRYDEEGNPYFDGSEREILFHMETDFADVDLKLKPRDMVFGGVFTL
jgi:hypothetical protein